MNSLPNKEKARIEKQRQSAKETAEKKHERWIFAIECYKKTHHNNLPTDYQLSNWVLTKDSLEYKEDSKYKEIVDSFIAKGYPLVMPTRKTCKRWIDYYKKLTA